MIGLLVRRASIALAVTALSLSCRGDSTSPSGQTTSAGTPAQLKILMGASAKALAGDTLRVPVLVTDSAGRPIPNVIVYFSRDVNESGYSSPTPSDSTGVATGLLRVATAAGDYTAEAAVTQTPDGRPSSVKARFVVFVRGGPAVGIVHAANAYPQSYQGGTIPTPALTLYDQFGNLATTGLVTFRSEPGGSIPLTTQMPDSFGHVASQPWTLGTKMGVYRLITLAGATADTISTQVLSGPPASIAANFSPIVTAVGSITREQPAVRVTDAEGRGVPGARVTWSDSTGELSGCASTTVGSGVARIGCPWPTGDLPGDYHVTGTTAGLSATITIHALEAPAQIEIVSGPAPGSAWPPGTIHDLTVRLRLAGGAPAVGYVVLGYPPVTTDAEGIAHIRWDLGNLIGVHTITLTPALFPTITRSLSVLVVGEPRYFAIAAGSAHTCATTVSWISLYADWPVLCWGNNAYGQLGDGTAKTRLTPVADRTTPRGVTSEYFHPAAGGFVTCVGRSAVNAYVGSDVPQSFRCRGRNDFGQTGAPPSPQSDGTELGALGTPTVGATHSCATPMLDISHDGRVNNLVAIGVRCWGDNRFGQLGDGTTTSRATPADVVTGALSRVSVLRAGDGFTCATNGAGEAYCWGKNSDGQLGDGTQTDGSLPVPVAGGLHFGTIAAGKAHACGITGDRQLYCWGRNDAGQLGDGSTTSRSTPTLVVGGQSFTALAAGDAYTCALTLTDLAFCWGDNRFGQLGTGTTASTTQPAAVSGGLTFTQLTAGGSHTCAIPNHNASGAFCWGLNADGQLGDGTRINRTVPTRVADYVSDTTTASSLRTRPRSSTRNGDRRGAPGALRAPRDRSAAPRP